MGADPLGEGPGMCDTVEGDLLTAEGWSDGAIRFTIGACVGAVVRGHPFRAMRVISATGVLCTVSLLARGRRDRALGRQ